MQPKEDPEAKKDRLRERRISLIERRNAAEQSASGLTSDLRGVYGLSGLSLFGVPGAKPKPAAAKTYYGPLPYSGLNRGEPGRA